MSTTTRTALLALLATRTFAALDDVAVVLGMKPATFAETVRLRGSRLRATIEAAGFVVDVRCDELRAA